MAAACRAVLDAAQSAADQLDVDVECFGGSIAARKSPCCRASMASAARCSAIWSIRKLDIQRIQIIKVAYLGLARLLVVAVFLVVCSSTLPKAFARKLATQIFP